VSDFYLGNYYSEKPKIPIGVWIISRLHNHISRTRYMKPQLWYFVCRI